MKYNLKLENKELKVDFDGLAEQANGSILVSIGDTLVLTTSVMSKQDRENLGFFPLTVEYLERYYAAGKIKGSRYIKREGRPSDEAICNARLIDRAIRPRFPKGLKREIQVISTVLSWDRENDPDVLGLLGASFALSVSDIPWDGPLGVVRVCRQKDGKFILNPSYEEREGNDLDVVFSGVEKDKEILINMIEGKFEEVSEETILEAFDFAEKYLKKLIVFQNEIKQKIGKKKEIIPKPVKNPALEKEIKSFLKDRLEKAVFEKKIEELKIELASFVEENQLGDAFDFLEEEINRLVCDNVVKYKKRPDGRKLDEVRNISCKAGILPRTHGSGLFCRGKTKALSILTLGGPADQQLLEGMEIVGKKRFMHHYNFPPYSAGEVGFLRGPGRREIGHGVLAEKALLTLIPDPENFPYTIRVVTEILSSNGSTSMASVSSSSLALMDAGVPIKNPVAGIAMGLIGGKVLTDIQGPEDHYGDMDFKVAGTKQGITVAQMDVKIEGISREIMKQALFGAKKARLDILKEMKKVLEKPRPELSCFAPRILTVQINPEKIREVIGPGGKVINEIIEKTGAQIDIQDSGLIFITSEEQEAAQKAVNWIKDIVREAEVGEVFQGKVKRILEFGAFVEVLPGQEGLIHISKLAPGRVNKVEDVVKIGDNVSVKVISIDEQGRINLSLLKNNKQ